LAQSAGLNCDDGIQVDDYCRTSDPHIVAAGDCTRHPNVLSQRAVRLETVHNAVEQAKAAAATMAGRDEPYRQAPWVWSDQYNLRLQSVGLWQDHDEWVMRGHVADGRFSVYYFRAGQFIAMEAVNQPVEFGASRRLLNEGIDLTPSAAADQGFDLKRLLPSNRRFVFERPWPARQLGPLDRRQLATP
jgi:3-phenylpropionate/trans-cinnamate dioxygenase ferredoxin reductase subunit